MICEGTFSLVARCPETGDVGVAVATRRLAVGNRVPFIKAGVGAVAVQAWGRPPIGEKGIQLLEQGVSAEDALQQLLEYDPYPQLRQIALVDSSGIAAAHTGGDAPGAKGHRIVPGAVAAGNTLASENVVDAMAEAFTLSAGQFLGDRLFLVLKAGQQAGGDARGRQSACISVARVGYAPFLDLRVDDHPDPLMELERIYGLYQSEMLFAYALNGTR